ncbi:MAG: hypothetical protein NVV73_14455 [Cellvibrionaceae bacterium]|nr:hypothetical protein [Cellvibrionaceae bacterium]
MNERENNEHKINESNKKNENFNNGQALKEKLGAKLSHIKGWAVDADPKNDPTYPMRRREKTSSSSWVRPPQQSGHEHILHSNERPDVTRVFGTAAPAKGLSGMIRRCAFKYSEGRFAHWLLLLVADRVNTVEGFANDIAHGKSCHYLTDKGINAQWKYDRKTVVTKAAVGAAVVGLLAGICLRRHIPNIMPEKRHIWGLLDKHSKLQRFIQDYERMMRR